MITVLIITCVPMKTIQGDAERQLVGANWFRRPGGAGQPPSEGRDWNVYFQVKRMLVKVMERKRIITCVF